VFHPKSNSLFSAQLSIYVAVVHNIMKIRSVNINWQT
jgi:hypothetical protein